MLSYLRMDVYRLIRSRMLWVALAVLTLAFAASMFLLWFGTTPEFARWVNEEAAQNMAQVHVDGGAEGGDGPQAGPETGSGAVLDPEAAEAGGTQLVEEEVKMLNERSFPSVTYMYGGFITANLVTIVVSILIALLLVSDFETGYVRNLFSARRGRVAYFGAKLVLIVAVSAVFILFSMVAMEPLRLAAGFVYDRVESPGELLAWFGMTVCLVSAYVSVTAVVVWLTRSKAAGMVAAVGIGSGAVGTAAAVAFPQLAALWRPMEHAAGLLLVTQAKLLVPGIQGVLSSSSDVVHFLAVTVGVFALCAVAGVAAASRRDV